MSKKIQKEPTSLIGRYQQVIGALIKYGFEDIITHPPFVKLAPKSKRLIPNRNGRSILEYTRYERVRMLCEELGTTFIKFAQIASNRPDLLPEELIEELIKLQDKVPKVAWENVETVLEEEFDKPIKSLLQSLDHEPIASASMAQVHRAVLIGGKEVVLKIQRPNVAENIQSDITILTSLARTVEHYFPQYEAFQPMELVKMFERSILKELKFTQEAANAKRFQQQFLGHPNIYVPDVYMELTTDRVLCMEYIDGFKITDSRLWESVGMTGKDLALKGINLYFEQVFDHGFFHADPHPGNIFVMPDGKICFIDYGMMGFIIDSDKELLAEMLLAVHDQDVQGLKRSLQHFSTKDKIPNENELEYDIIEFFSNYSDITIDEIEGEEFIKALNSLFFDYKVKIPANLLLLMKALVIIEGVGLIIDPTYNIIKNIEPFVRRLIARKYNPQKITKNVIRSMGEFSRLAASLPDDTRSVLHKLREGKLHIEFEHKGLEPLYQKMSTVTNRISFTLVLVAIILGSSMIVIADLPPHVNHIPVLGLVGFIISGLLGIRLLWSIIKHGNF